MDIVRRAKLEIDMISINGTKQVTSSRNVTFMTDTTKEEADFSAYDGIILPGGMPGTVHLGEDDTVSQVIREFEKEGKLVAAICAAPSVLGQAGILNGKKAACHPGFEEKLTGAEVFFSPVVCDGNVITSRGMGTAVPFGLAVARNHRTCKSRTCIRINRFQKLSAFCSHNSSGSGHTILRHMRTAS